ncbi:hypothetical protein D3C84_944350 [compost metagenome]
MLQQPLQIRQPRVLAHQAVGGKRRQAMLQAQADALRVRHCRRGWIVHQLLLYVAQPRDQAQVIGQRMPFGKALQAQRAQGKQVLRWKVQKRRRCRRRFDLSRLQDGGQIVILFCPAVGRDADARRHGSLRGTRVRDVSWPRRG